MAANADWIQGHIARNPVPPGQRLPYDERFGISQREYDLLVNAYEHPTVMDQDRFEVDVKRDARGLHFVAPAPYSWLNDVVIEERGRLTMGAVEIDAPHSTSLKGKFGEWSGFSWTRQASQPPSSIDSLEVALGHTIEPRRRFAHIELHPVWWTG
jgi:hypothetical protein